MKKMKELLRFYLKNGRDINAILLGEAIGLAIAVGFFFFVVFLKMILFL